MQAASASFTVTANGLLRELVTDCGVSPTFTPASAQTKPDVVPFKAIWDTGASNCVITQKVVDACGLKPISMTQVHGVNSTDLCEVYLVGLYLPNKVAFLDMHVTKGKLAAGTADVLIGMDIITQGDFALTNKDAKTLFSFRVPSQSEIDYVKKHHEAAKTARSKAFRRGQHPQRAR